MSANDRSRWDTVRSLVEDGTYAIDNIVAQPGWDTIDMVQHKGRDGQKHLYSSKPPLLATLMAGPYWVVYHVYRRDAGNDHPYEIGRGLLILYNVPLLLVYFLILASLAERFGTTDWGRLFMMAAGDRRHLLDHVRRERHQPSAGARLPRPRRCGPSCASGTTASGAGRGSRWPALPRRSPLPANCRRCRYSRWSPWRCFGKRPALALTGLRAGRAGRGGGFVRHQLPGPRQFARALFASQRDRPGGQLVSLHLHDQRSRAGQLLDARRPASTRASRRPRVYAFHVLVGHHGIFSLTPVWLLSLVGLRHLDPLSRPPHVGCAIGLLTSGLPGVLSLAAANRSQLRRHDQRLAVDVLVRAAVAGVAAAGRRLICPAAAGARPWAWCYGPVSAVGQLSDLESLDHPLADERLAVLGAAAVAG